MSTFPVLSFSMAHFPRRQSIGVSPAFAMALPNFNNAPMIIILMIAHLLLVTVSGFYMPIHSAPPPSHQPACDPWSRDQLYSSRPQPDICASPNFDAAVSVSDSQMLLFKGAHMWLLDLLNYQVSQPLNNCFLQSCFGDRKTKGITQTRGNFGEGAGYAEPQQQQQPPQMQPYYVWNQHEKLRFYRNRICMQGAGEICPFAVDLRPTPTNNGLYRAPAAAPAQAPAAAAATVSSAPFAARNGSRPSFEHPKQQQQQQHYDHHGDELCRANMYGNGGDIIEMVLTQRNFHSQREGPQVAQLVGRHFRAFVMYTPSTYDHHLVYFKVELYKLYQEVQERRGSRQEADSDEPSDGLEEAAEPVVAEPKHRLIENVNTFAVLPTGELMVFFADHFCLINYYNLECKLRPTASDLLGCGMPDSEYDVSPNQLNIVAPDRVNTSSDDSHDGKRQSENGNQKTAKTEANAKGKGHHSAADSSQANETSDSGSAAISDASSSRLDSSLPANTTTTTSTPFPTAVPSSSAPSTGSEQYSSGVSTLRHQDNDSVTVSPASQSSAGAGATSTLTSSSSSSLPSSLSPGLSPAPESSTVVPGMSGGGGGGEKQDGSSNSQSQQSSPPSVETAISSTTASITRAVLNNNSGKGREDGQSYDIDFLYRKRDAVKRSPTHDPAELYFGNLSRRFSFFWTGCASLLTIGNRAFSSFFIAFAVTHLLAVLLLSLFHRFKRIDFTVLLYIYFFSLGRMMSEY